MEPLEILLVNAGKAVRTVRNGRSYLVAPLTLIVPGVLAGDKGPLLYPTEVVGKNASSWNGIPIVVNHPILNGQYVSARSPEMREKWEIGRVYNVKGITPLQGEGWFDEEDTLRVDPRIHDALTRGKKIEVSTGLNTLTTPAPEGSVHNGKSYTHVVQDYRPDHLAVLPDQKGACSIQDGCGVFNAQPSHQELRSQLSVLLEKRFGRGGMMGGEYDMPACYILDVYDKEVVYEVYDKLWKIKYTTDLRTSTVELAPEAPVEVRRVTTYKPVANSHGDTSERELTISYEEIDVNRDQWINALVANCDCWKGNGDRDVLNKFTDEKLKTLYEGMQKAKNAEAVANAARAGFEHGDTGFTFDEATQKWVPKAKTPAPVTTPVVNSAHVQVAVAKPLTEQEWLASAPPGIQSVVANAMRMEQEEKATLVQKLTVNAVEPEKTNLTQWLNTQPVDTLRQMAKILPKAAPAPTPPLFPSFATASVPAPVTQVANNSQDDLLPLPVMNWSRESA